MNKYEVGGLAICAAVSSWIFGEKSGAAIANGAHKTRTRIKNAVVPAAVTAATVYGITKLDSQASASLAAMAAIPVAEVFTKKEVLEKNNIKPTNEPLDINDDDAVVFFNVDTCECFYARLKDVIQPADNNGKRMYIIDPNGTGEINETQNCDWSD